MREIRRFVRKAGLRAVCDPLEGRRLFAAAVEPILHALRPNPALPHADWFAPQMQLTAGRGVDASTPTVLAKAVSAFTIDMADVQRTLGVAPREGTAAGRASGAIAIALPLPDGSMQRFDVLATQVMAPELAARYKSIRTFAGVGIDDPSASVRLDYTPLGFHAQVLSSKGTFYIDPYHHNEAAGTYVSYYKRDAIRTGEPSAEWGDEDHAHESAPAADFGVGDIRNYGGELRTYRLAVAATGEYTLQAGGGTVAGGMAAITTAINRVTGVYETELGIRFQLIANNDQIVYRAASSDPYTNNSGSTMLSQNQTNLDAVIGNANYDVGHVFSTGGGGIATLWAAGRDGYKARGVTGKFFPTGDAFYIDYVCHEIGHQFGARHTFNSPNSPGQWAVQAAFEPGSGSTIMGYAGLMGDDNLQTNSDPFFHSHSMFEVRDHVEINIPSVGAITLDGNDAPLVNAGLDYVIPARTPFELTATGSDENGDTVLYDWQQYDLGSPVNLGATDAAEGPLFRVWNPTTSPSRTFPRLADLLNNTFAKGEALPTASRPSMDFMLVGRDGRGGVDTDEMFLNVVDTGAAFEVTSFNSATTAVDGGSTQTITWNVAGTDANGINAASVRILLSADGGLTYPHVLLASTANDGSADVTLPDIATTTARIKIQAVDNVFFDINNANFEIAPTLGAPWATLDGSGELTVAGTEGSDLINLTLIDGGATVEARRNGTETATFPAASVVTLVVNGLNGNDAISNFINRPSTLNGQNGADTLLGGDRDDRLVGGPDNDRYEFAPATVAQTDTLVEQPSGGIDTIDFHYILSGTNIFVNLSSDGLIASHTNRSVTMSASYTARYIENAIGGEGNDNIAGNHLSNSLVGNAGNDTIIGGDGNDTQVGGAGDDRYVMGASRFLQTETIVEGAAAGSGNDTLDLGTVPAGTDIAVDLTSNINTATYTNRIVNVTDAANLENVIGGGGDDTLVGNAAANVLNGGGGNDTLTGQTVDTLTGSTGLDKVLKTGAPLEYYLDNIQTVGGGQTISGSWGASTGSGAFFAANYLTDGNTGKGAKSIAFAPPFLSTQTRNYKVYARWPAASNRATNVPIDIHSAAGVRTVVVNQRLNDNAWVYLGTFPFDAGRAGQKVVIRNAGTDGYVVVDALKFTDAGGAIVDNGAATFTGTWNSSDGGGTQKWGASYRHDANAGKGTKTATFTPNLGTAGTYAVYGRWAADVNRATNVPIDILHASGTSTVAANQRLNGGNWVLLGTYAFNAGTAGNVTIRTTGTTGYVIADAVRFVKVG